MSDAPDNSADPSPDQPSGAIDPAALKGAHSRTGRMLKHAGLPFEADEFEGDGDEDSSSSSSDSESSDD